MDDVITALRAVAEPTRLRLLAICARGEITVTELTQVLGISQPRVSHHLKQLCDARLLERFKEGTWVFYRAPDGRDGNSLASRLVDLIPFESPQIVRDSERVGEIKQARAANAAAYFRANAERWDSIRSLHVDTREVDAVLKEALPEENLGNLLDVGTGTGSVLQLFSDAADWAVGIDLSHEMIRVARVNLDEAGLTNCQVRVGDMYSIPAESGSFDVVTLHQVLHYAERPAAAVAEAARVLRPGGRLVIVDIGPHDLEQLRTVHAHRRLGFAESEVIEWCETAGLEVDLVRHLPGDPLTVTLWRATRPEPVENPTSLTREPLEVRP